MRRISKNWAEYNESLPNSPDVQIVETEWAAPLKSFISGRNISVLEIGCSNGRYLTKLGQIVESEDLVGVDIIACKTPESMHFVQADALKLPFMDGSFDLVYSMGVLEHFKQVDRERLIEEQSRILRPGGIMMIIMPNCTIGSVRFAKTKFLDLFRDFHHVAFTPSQIREEMGRHQIQVLFERFIGSSLHIGRYQAPGTKSSKGSRISSEEYAIIGRKVSLA